jgi:hypothetical protein
MKMLVTEHKATGQVCGYFEACRYVAVNFKSLMELAFQSVPRGYPEVLDWRQQEWLLKKSVRIS